MRRHRLTGTRLGAGCGKTLTDAFHIDAYRLKKPGHLTALGLDALLRGPGNVIVIEWPEQARRFLPKGTVWLTFTHGRKENERTITITRRP
jgi:tRNA A37 threonylcarbamoyladenosine biosynthesis protein TsaE